MTMVLAATLHEREEYRMSEEEKNANMAKGELLATLSHEIRTPLNGVIGSTELLKTTGLNPEQEKYVSILSGTAKTLGGLVNNILDYSKLEVGKLQMESIPIDIDLLLDEIESMFVDNTRKKGIEFKLQKENLPKAVMGDPLRIKQILVNLTGNAIKFTESGSVTLSACYETGTMHFAVTDTGIGMTEEDMARLFTPFQQARSEIARKFRGTGLGLRISSQLAELMGSYIHVSSKVWEGATFSLSLKLAEAPKTQLDESNEHNINPHFASKYPYRILIVDDTEVNRIIARAMLTKLGYTNIEECDEGYAAVTMIEQGNFDLVLLDVQMPGIDGTDVAKLVKDKMSTPPRLIAVTGNTAHEDQQIYLRVMDDYMSKPITFETLTRVLRRAILA